MWMHPRRNEPNVPPEDISGRARDLSRRLLSAIERQNTDDARKIFDEAFWGKVDFKPDGYHLLQAARLGDRAMVTLLAANGASWTDAETHLARSLVKPEQWARVEGPLKHAGIRTTFDKDAPVDRLLALSFAKRAAEDSADRGQPQARLHAAELKAMVQVQLIDAVGANNMPLARDILKHRDVSLGLGTKNSPLNISAEIEVLARASMWSPARLLQFIDRLKDDGFELKPVETTFLMTFLRPDVIPALHSRGMLAENQPVARREVLDGWTGTQEILSFGSYTIDISPASVARRRAEFNAIAKIIFKKPLNNVEAERFIQLHASRMKSTPDGLQAAEKDLLAMGFFDGPAWTAERMRALAALPVTDEKLSKAFNSRAVRLTLEEVGTDNLINDKKFQLFVDAHAHGFYAADAATTAKAVKYLSKQVSKDVVPDSVVAALTAMKQGGADFSAVDPMPYVGKRAPALAKTLLDLDIVTARHFDIIAIAKRFRGELKVGGADEKSRPNTEFVCQLILEIVKPDTYVPLRKSNTESYQRLFLREWASDLHKEANSFTYKRQGPGRG